DILQFLFANVLVRRVELAAHLSVDILGDANAARHSEAFKPHRYVDAVPEDIAIFYDNIANIDADAKFDPTVFSANRSVGHLVLGFQGAPHRVNSACKLNQRPIARVLYNAATVLGDLWIDEGLAKVFERRERSFFIDAH